MLSMPGRDNSVDQMLHRLKMHRCPMSSFLTRYDHRRLGCQEFWRYVYSLARERSSTGWSSPPNIKVEAIEAAVLQCHQAMSGVPSVSSTAGVVVVLTSTWLSSTYSVRMRLRRVTTTAATTAMHATAPSAIDPWAVIAALETRRVNTEVWTEVQATGTSEDQD